AADPGRAAPAGRGRSGSNRLRADTGDRGNRRRRAALPARRPADRRGVTDTHAHLDACEEPADVLVARADDAGVTRIVSVGSGRASCQETLAIAQRHDGVFAALGIHPHQAAEEDAERLDDLRELLRHDQAVAVGETGLDYYRDYAPRDRQLVLFERQL